MKSNSKVIALWSNAVVMLWILVIVITGLMPDSDRFIIFYLVSLWILPFAAIVNVAFTWFYVSESSEYWSWILLFLALLPLLLGGGFLLLR